MVTLSLGSHTVLDVHHFLSTTSPSPPLIASTTADSKTDHGRPIAAIPLAHLLLLPRSLLILSSSLYASHLHGIVARADDVVRSPSEGVAASSDGVTIANESLLEDSAITNALREHGQWSGARSTRTSMTFRHALKVFRAGRFGIGGRVLGK